MKYLVDEADPSNSLDFIDMEGPVESDPKIDMRHLLGYMNQNLYHDYLNIT